MKKIDKLILDLSIFIGYSTDEVRPIINAVYKRDYAHFVSQMADFDCPHERIGANKIFDSEMKDVRATVFEKVIKCLNDRFNDYYHTNFHTMNEEC